MSHTVQGKSEEDPRLNLRVRTACAIAAVFLLKGTAAGPALPVKFGQVLYLRSTPSSVQLRASVREQEVAVSDAAAVVVTFGNAAVSCI